jgi:hypothetical protein
VILAALALLFAQDVPGQDAVQGEDIVVRATFGRTTMLFDKGADGRLRNCRIMVSSGSQKRDTTACQSTPVCYARTADEVTDCRELTILEQAAVAGSRPAVPVEGKGAAQVFELPKLVPPKAPVAPIAIGPSGLAEDSRDTERQRLTKLPPPPSAPTDGPPIKLSVSNTADDKRDNTRP